MPTFTRTTLTAAATAGTTATTRSRAAGTRSTGRHAPRPRRRSITITGGTDPTGRSPIPAAPDGQDAVRPPLSGQTGLSPVNTRLSPAKTGLRRVCISISGRSSPPRPCRATPRPGARRRRRSRRSPWERATGQNMFYTFHDFFVTLHRGIGSRFLFRITCLGPDVVGSRAHFRQ